MVFRKNYSSSTNRYNVSLRAHSEAISTRCRGAFTFLEILITLCIIAVLFLPMMRLFSYALNSTTYSKELITATNLAKWQMERLKNIAVTKEQVRAMGNTVYPEENKPPLIVNNIPWRIKQIIKEGDPLEVRVEVYRDKESPLMTLVTLIEDTIWVEND